MSKKRKFSFFLNLEWIFDRLSHELSFSMYKPDDHVVRKFSKKFLLECIQETDIVLDLGCKQGEISDAIAEKAKEVVGIDYDKKAIDAARERYKRDNLSFLNMEAYDYLVDNKKIFDVLVLSHILEHLDEPESFLNTFKHFFGYIYIELPDFDKSYLNHYRKDCNLNLVYTDPDHITEFDRLDMKHLLDSCNITILREEYRFGVQKLWCRI